MASQRDQESVAVFPAEREVLEETFGRLVVRRTLFVPIPLLVLGFVIFYETVTWRRVALTVLSLVFLTLTLIDAWSVRNVRHRPNAMAINLAIIGVVQPAIVFSTGGLASPVLPILPAFALSFGLFASPTLRRTLLTLQILLIWTMAGLHWTGALPAFVPELLGAERPIAGPLLSALAVSMMLFASVAAGRKLRALFVDVIRRELAARDEALQTHREQTRALTTLSAEIAHELKNPLASVKGLAALVSKEMTGKQAERMAVLRRETDRMQAIVDGFLNFSRPVTPLAVEQVDLRSLADAVMALHEGMAREKRLRLTVVPPPSPVEVGCDRRKIHQVLINLLQNAIEASPPGESVEVYAARDAHGARIEVRDRGPGLPQALEARLFEPGVTTRPSGSGLGLSIARGLVRQHGGELELLPRTGGGTVALITLPDERPGLEKSA